MRHPLSFRRSGFSSVCSRSAPPFSWSIVRPTQVQGSCQPRPARYLPRSKGVQKRGPRSGRGRGSKALLPAVEREARRARPPSGRGRSRAKKDFPPAQARWHRRPRPRARSLRRASRRSRLLAEGATATLPQALAAGRLAARSNDDGDPTPIGAARVLRGAGRRRPLPRLHQHVRGQDLLHPERVDGRHAPGRRPPLRQPLHLRAGADRRSAKRSCPAARSTTATSSSSVRPRRPSRPGEALHRAARRQGRGGRQGALPQRREGRRRRLHQPPRPAALPAPRRG